MAHCLQGTICFELIKGLPAAFVTLIIGFIAALIAWRQYRVAAAKLKLDLFDKRYLIFQKTWEIFSEVVRDGTRAKSYGLATPFNNFLPQAAFLFGTDIYTYLDQASKNWTELRGLEAEETAVTGSDKSENIARASELRQWFHDEASEGAKRTFEKYLSFERWK
ncbi:MAG: hypothetical protein ABUS47_03545 [Steroidobacter sp.]